jgi:pyridinium-3,5-bisthiocarboxylic acid mononucleotide nickel chelatase
MRIAYLDCASGISGDMTLGALMDAGVSLEALQEVVASLGIPGCVLEVQEVKRKGFRASKVYVRHPEQRAHRHLKHVLEILYRGKMTDRQRGMAERVFQRLAEAEAKVHGSTIEKVHFHEVGAVDSIVDIIGSCVAWDLLGVERMICSPIPTGQGFIQIDHGRVSLPAPATAELLKGIPLAASTVDGELTTPTGAALVATLVNDFAPLPTMTIEQIGYGAGEKNFESHANILRILVGSSSIVAAQDDILCMEANLDNCSGEWIGHCVGELFAAGALDVYTTSIQMKKNRPGVLLGVLCKPVQRDALARILFRDTTTLGIRMWPASRWILERREINVSTKYGVIRGKLACLPDGTQAYSPEFESCRELAQRLNISVRTVMQEAFVAYERAKNE